MTLAPGTTLGPYRVETRLGVGGMGVVYQATDPRLKRTVAIKVLPSDLTRDEDAKQRFLQEAQAASALDHPNICTIHEINETDDGQLYLVMAHYHGETLKERIARGPMSLDDALDIAAQVGDGLAEAHKVNIVHRDIKPANLFLTKTGTVKILDFGLAKLGGSEGVTQTGTTVGTVAYMSPEQARGQEVDHRTDIWSLGVVLYEMLAAEPPFQGQNLLSISNAILEREYHPLSGAAAPAQPIVAQALCKSRAQRYQAADVLLADLRTLQSGLVTPTVLTPGRTDVPSIAVLPFVNMSADPEQEYFCEGLAEELIDALARLDGLRVVSRSSSFQFRDKGHDLRAVGQRLEVQTVLEGSVRKAGTRLRINVQLISTDDDDHLWSQRYDRDMDDIFAVQDDIARAVVDKLKVKLLAGPETPLVKPPTESMEAYHLVLQGRYWSLRATRNALDKGQTCFTQALAIDPAYAQAHAGIATALAIRAIVSSAAPHDVMPKAKEAAVEALALDDSLADAHDALGFVLCYYEWDWVGAERAYRRAIELNPSDAQPRTGYANLLGILGRDDESVAVARSAVECDPLLPSCRYMLAQVLVLARRFEEGLAEARAVIELDARYPHAYQALGWALVGLGRHDEAVGAMKQYASAASGEPQAQAFLGWALAVAGHQQEARAILADLEQRHRQTYVGGIYPASVCVGLSDYDHAISWLQRAVEEHDGSLSFISRLLIFDPLRSDARFAALLHHMNLAKRSQH